MAAPAVIRTPSVWVQVHVHDYLIDPNGHPWKVIDYRDGWFLLQDPAGARMPVAPQPDHAPVTRLVPTEEEVLSVLSATFGATIVQPEGNP